MKIIGPSGWRLIVEIAVGGAVSAGMFMLILYHTSFGDRFPEELKFWSPIGLWAITVAYFAAHLSPDRYVEFTIWKRKKKCGAPLK